MKTRRLFWRVNRKGIPQEVTFMFSASTEQRRRFRHAPNVMTFLLLITSLIAGVVTARQTSAQTDDKLTGNWAVRTPNADGTFRVTYLNLKQEGSRITGSIRLT